MASKIKEVKYALATWTSEAVATIKTFHALFASENHYYGKIDEMQYTYYCFVKDVRSQDNGIKGIFQVSEPNSTAKNQ